MSDKEGYEPDELDIKILSELQERCNISIRKLANKLDIPTSTIQRRIVNLQEKEIIKGCRAILNKDYLGYNNLFSLVKVTTGFIKDEGGYLESFAEDEIKERYDAGYEFRFVVDNRNGLKANPWEFVLDVFSSLTPKPYGKDIASIQIIYAIHGRYDILVKVVGTDQKICGKYIEDKIAIIPGITGIETLTVFDVKKDDDRVPFLMEYQG
ncbi:MAG: Lrp/AsnC family transcriptional regulator [Methanomassiliicoccales archaeon]|nr:MAG: Lrp/AsnC family transcriptional regulator [Methanomassiliicoccales archaeon]